MEQPQIRNPYNYDSDQLSEDTGLKCEDESLCEQQFVEESDINYIANKFMQTGELPQILDLPTPGDFEGIFDFQSAMNTIAKAKEEFMSLPAKIRTRFSNDPQQLLDFVDDKDNYDEAVKLGFIPKKETNDEKGTGRPAEATPEKPQGDTRTTGNTQDAAGTHKP